MAQSYLPASDADRVIWLNNFKTKLAQHATLFGFTAAEVTSAQNDAAYFQYVVQSVDNHRQTVIALTSYKTHLRSSVQPLPPFPVVPAPATVPVAVAGGIFKRVATYVARIRNHPSYTATLGQEFGILPPQSAPINPSSWQPVLTVTMDSGRPKIRWVKGDADGLVLYVDRGDGNGFVELDKVGGNSYIDGEELPANTLAATWSYYAKYLFDFEEVGLASQTVTVNVVKQ